MAAFYFKMATADCSCRLFSIILGKRLVLSKFLNRSYKKEYENSDTFLGQCFSDEAVQEEMRRAGVGGRMETRRDVRINEGQRLYGALSIRYSPGPTQ